jgi:hypothetical protein
VSRRALRLTFFWLKCGRRAVADKGAETFILYALTGDSMLWAKYLIGIDEHSKIKDSQPNREDFRLSSRGFTISTPDIHRYMTKIHNCTTRLHD